MSFYQPKSPPIAEMKGTAADRKVETVPRIPKREAKFIV